MSLLQAKNFYRSYGDHPLPDQVSLTPKPGERLCLVSLNGSGKSTLLKIPARSIEVDDGEIVRRAT